MYRIPLFILAIVALAGCNTSGCLDNQNSIPLAGFYSSATEKAVMISNIEIGGVGAPGDSLLAKSAAQLSQIYLPLRSSYNSATFYFRYTEPELAYYGVVDYITLDYDSEPWFAGEECGAMYRYRITACHYTREVIDSVAIVDSLITNVDKERIRIYFRTSDGKPE